MKKNKNSVQKEVGAKKKAGEACDEMVAEVKSLGETIEQMEKQQEETKTQLDSLLGKIGRDYTYYVHMKNNFCKDFYPKATSWTTLFLLVKTKTLIIA